jgi:hypothetical protein
MTQPADLSPPPSPGAGAGIKLLYSVPSLGLDDSKGPPTFVFVTHELPFHEFPYTFPEDAGFFVSNGWLGTPGVYRQRIELLEPSGTLLAETGERELEMIDERPYLAITYFQGLTFAEQGTYRIRISVDGAEVLSYPLFVTLADPADPGES